MTPSLVIRVLGPLEVERADEVLQIGSPMQRRLLTALVVAHGETVSTDRLVDALWGADPPESARNSLQTYVARLRSSLGDPSIVVTRPMGYALDTSRLAVDAWTIEHLVSSLRRSLAADPAAAAIALGEALAGWRGDAYDEFADGFAREAATRIGDLRLEAMELLATAHLQAGCPAEALAALDEMPPSAALRERCVLLRAEALTAAGRLPDALASLRAYRGRLADEFGLDASAAVDELERRLLRGDLGSHGDHTTPGGAPGVGSTSVGGEPGLAPHGPPRLATETLGRDEDHARIVAAFEASPLVTLVGPGGVGKTRLAMVVGDQASAVAWVDLAPVRRDEDVVPAFAEGLGISVSSGTSVGRTVAETLGQFSGTVIVDNCEHVLDPVAELIDTALSRPGPVRILATSRERLDVARELVLPITPLVAPAPAEATGDDPAVRLFLDRLTAAGGGPVSPGLAAEVVAAVDGLPLAIELAAARAVSLPIEDLVERLHQRIDVLDGTRRRHGDRHRTLDQVITWSHDLLPPACRVLFRRLSAFTATFRLVDAERICADHDLPSDRVAPALARLVDASMVARLDDGRFRVLEPLRLYAAAKLAESEDAVAVQERQRQAALELTALADAAVSGPDETATVAEVEAALPDLRAVHARAVEADDLATIATMAARLYRFAYLQARSDVLLWGARLVAPAASDVDVGDRARALAAAAAGSWMIGDLAGALAFADAAEPLARDPWSRLTVTEALGDARLSVGELDAAVAAYTANLTCAEEVGHPGLVANAEVGLAFALFQRGDQGQAEALAASGRSRAIASGSPSVQALAEYTLGEVLAGTDPDRALVSFERARVIAVAGRARLHEGLARTADVALRGRHGAPDEALRRYRDALELWRTIGADGLLLTALRNLVVLLVRIGADQAALEIHAAIERMATRPSYGEEARRVDGAVTAARERLGPEAANAAAVATAEIHDLRAAAARALANIAAVAEPEPPRSRGTP